MYLQPHALPVFTQLLANAELASYDFEFDKSLWMIGAYHHTFKDLKVSVSRKIEAGCCASIWL